MDRDVSGGESRRAGGRRARTRFVTAVGRGSGSKLTPSQHALQAMRSTGLLHANNRLFLLVASQCQPYITHSHVMPRCRCGMCVPNAVPSTLAKRTSLTCGAPDTFGCTYLALLLRAPLSVRAAPSQHSTPDRTPRSSHMHDGVMQQCSIRIRPSARRPFRPPPRQPSARACTCRPRAARAACRPRPRRS